MAKAKVTGNEEVNQALRDFRRNIDLPEASQAAGEAMLPYVKAASREDTGAMSAGWGVKQTETGAEFINREYYFTFQEFGTEFIEPTYAIFLAWEQASDQAVEAYANAARDAARDAGWDERH